MQAIIFLYSLLFLALYAITGHFVRKLRNLPPSPFLALPIIGHFYLFSKPIHRALSKLSERHGPILILRFGSRPVLLVSSPSAAEECFGRNDAAFANRPQLLAGKHLGYNYTSLVWAPHGEHWRNLRRIASNEILSSARLHATADLRADEVRSLMCRLDRVSREASTVELKPFLSQLMLNNMMRMIAGKRYYGDDGVEAGEAWRFGEMVSDALRLGGTTNLSDFVPVFRWLFGGGYEKSLVDLQMRRDRFMQSLIEENRKRSASPNSEKNMIEVLLSLQESDPEYYTDEIIRGIMLALLSAGTDTTSGTMEWAMSLMVNNPKIMRKARDEVDHRVGKHRLVNESDLSNLPYLHRIIKETARLYPVAALIPHESSQECTVAGYRVPCGTMLLVNSWAIQHDPRVWEAPEEFRPERFKEGEATVREGFRLFPFGVGRRGCPGENLGMRMVGVALAALLQCFDWETVDGRAVDMSESHGLSLSKARSSPFKCRPRPSMPHILSPPFK